MLAVGRYFLCVIEEIPTTETPEGYLIFENWWIFELGLTE